MKNENLDSIRDKKKQVVDKIKKLQKKLAELNEQENSFIAGTVKALMDKNNLSLEDIASLLDGDEKETVSDEKQEERYEE